jgi:6-phosphogluconolactonase/glucosamine-6-phosphate isomerase/deaminase
LDAAGYVMPMVGGASKAQIVKRILTGAHDPRELPAQLATGPNATWLLDRAAAAELEGLKPAS